VRTIADRLSIPASTVYSHLVEKIGLKDFLFRSKPNAGRRAVQKRVELAEQLLLVLQGQQRVDFRNIVTGDELRFLLHYDHRPIWCVSVDAIPTRVVHAITARRNMFTVFLSIAGGIFINWLPPREEFNSDYFCEKILKPLSEILHSRRAARSASPMLHFENAAPRRSAVTKNCFENCQFPHAPQPPDSLDTSPCDLFRFQ
jgi:hypothetical protein